jgi:hypothetical protein
MMWLWRKFWYWRLQVHCRKQVMREIEKLIEEKRVKNS